MNDLFFPKSRPATGSSNAADLSPGAQPAVGDFRRPVSSPAEPPRSPGEFASAMRRALDAKTSPAKAVEADAKATVDELGHEETVEIEGPETQAEDHESGDANNIILFPDPNVIIPFPVALAAGEGTSRNGDTFVLAAESQAGGQAPMDGSAAAASEPATSGSPDQKIVPLPTTPQSKASAASENKARRDEDDGIDVTKLGLRPTRPAGQAGNIEPVNFQNTPPVAGKPTGEGGKMVEVAFPSQTAEGATSPPQGTTGPTQLPGGAPIPEKSALLGERVPTGSKTSAATPNAGKAPYSTVLPGGAEPPPEAAEPAGTTAARQESRMNLLMDARHERALLPSADAEPAEAALEDVLNGSPSGTTDPDASTEFSSTYPEAMDWQLGRPVSRIDRTASEVSPQFADSAGSVERLSNLIVREAALVRQYKSDALAVVLRPDAETELFVHFTQRNGQIEATVRCERGDLQQLGALWPQLQESLGQQKVRLAPLQESPSQQSNFNASNGSQAGGGQNHHHSPRQSPDRHSMDEWPAPASSAAEPRHVRGGGGSGHRRVTTSRPGWETWA